MGLVAGGVIGALSIGLGKEHHEKYEQLLKEGKFLVIVHGPESEISRANDILNAHGTHVGLEMH